MQSLVDRVLRKKQPSADLRPGTEYHSYNLIASELQRVEAERDGPKRWERTPLCSGQYPTSRARMETHNGYPRFDVVESLKRFHGINIRQVRMHGTSGVALDSGVAIPQD